MIERGKLLKFIFIAIRTSLLIGAGFIMYELFSEFYKGLDPLVPEITLNHFLSYKVFNLGMIFVLDLTLLVLIYKLFGIEL
jgi:hypothetical protein